jgi:hypothetical protein
MDQITPRPEQHCPTCVCNTPMGQFDLFNRRCHQLIRKIDPRADLGLTQEVIDRLPPHNPRYQLGFTGWKLNPINTYAAGQFLAAIARRGTDWSDPYNPPETRLFVVQARRSKVPTAEEYLRDEPFDISGSLHIEDIELMASWSDEFLVQYLRTHLFALAEKVKLIAAEW